MDLPSIGDKMSEKWDIDGVNSRYIGVTPCWDVTLKRPDGNRVTHLIPMVSLEIRAAEYGIDPQDVESLMSIILHEPHMPTTVDDSGSIKYDDGSSDLYSAESTNQARQAHLDRIKSAPVQISVKGHKALDLIKATHKPNLDFVQQQRERVDTRRWVRKYGSLPVQNTVKSPKSAAGQMAKSLGLTVKLFDFEQE